MVVKTTVSNLEKLNSSATDNKQEIMAYEDKNKEFEQYYTSVEPGEEERARNWSIDL